MPAQLTPALIVALLLLLLLLLLRSANWLPRRLTVYEFERGLRYTGGRASGLLGPGQYWVAPYRTTVTKVDMRPRFTTLGGQEVLSADGLAMKFSLAARYEVAEPLVAVNEVQDYQGTLYLELQLALRGVVGGLKVDELLERRAEIGTRVQELATARAAALGVRLLAVEVKDIMFPGDLKRIFSQVVKARQEGLASLEKARGETAALRNLANAARLVEERPALWQLRLLQQVSAGSGNTVMVGLPPTVPPPARAPQAEGELPPKVDEG